jgi:hypothetical protein
MTHFLSHNSNGWAPTVQTSRPTIVRVTPVVVIILVIVQHLLARVEQVSVVFVG